MSAEPASRLTKDERILDNAAAAVATRVAAKYLRRDLSANEVAAIDRFVRDLSSSMRAAARPAGDGFERGSLAPPEHVKDGSDAMQRDHVEAIFRARDRIRARVAECARFCEDLDNLPRLEAVIGRPGHDVPEDRVRAMAAWAAASPELRDAVAAADARVRALMDVLGEVERVADYVRLRGPEPVGRRAVTRKAAELLWCYVDQLDRKAPTRHPAMRFPYFSLPRTAARLIVDAGGRAGFPALSRTWHESRGND